MTYSDQNLVLGSPTACGAEPIVQRLETTMETRAEMGEPAQGNQDKGVFVANDLT